jgi:hypothetical protein
LLKAKENTRQKMMPGQFGFEILELQTIRAILLIEGLTTEFIGVESPLQDLLIRKQGVPHHRLKKTRNLLIQKEK